MADLIETKTITVKVYRDKNGKPTCMSDLPAGRICQWLRVQKFGTIEICIATDEKISRDNGGRGYTRPVLTCPIWSK